MHIEQFVNSGCLCVRFGLRAIVASMIFFALPTLAGTLDRIKETGHIKLGYAPDARPFTYRNEAGKPEGYAVMLCEQIADRVKRQLELTDLTVDWVEVGLENAQTEVQQGGIDLLCVPATETLTRRKDVAFSIPVFAGGVRAVVRKDTAAALHEILGDNPQPKPLWRGSPAIKTLDKKVFAVVPTTTSDIWLASKIESLKVDARTTHVPNYREGLQMLMDRKVDAFFGERSAMLSAMDKAQRENLVILDRLFTHEPRSFMLARGDEDFRLLVDRTLSSAYASPNFGDQYGKWFGEFNEKTRTFFLWSTVMQ